MSLLFGIMVEDGLLSLDTTLGEIFTDDDAWADVTDGSTDFRKGVTVEELLTMTSGLVNNFEMLGNSRAVFAELQESLSIPLIGVKGEFSYLVSSQIPSYIIVKLTGMTPRQYLAKHVMRKVGIGEDEYDWRHNDEGVQEGGGAMLLTPMEMAKFGQLYLQGGRTNPSNDERVISQEWIDASFTQHATTDYSSIPGVDDLLGKVNGTPHGYLFYGLYEHPSGSTVYCAMGSGGQFICVDRDLGRVAVQQMEGQLSSIDGFKALDLAFDNTLSFRAPNGGLSGISSTEESRTE
jgi:CubicO group peptidase (beta-lactamase class C family)